MEPTDNELDLRQTGPSVIIEGFMFVGSRYDATPHNVTKFGITHLINCATDVPRPSWTFSDEAQAEQSPDVVCEPPLSPMSPSTSTSLRSLRYDEIPLKDNDQDRLEDHADRIVTLLSQIHEEKGKVLIFCARGESRSVTVAMVFLMCVVSLSYNEALTLVRQTRPKACPNFNLSQQLRTLCVEAPGGTSVGSEDGGGQSHVQSFANSRRTSGGSEAGFDWGTGSNMGLGGLERNESSGNLRGLDLASRKQSFAVFRSGGVSPQPGMADLRTRVAGKLSRTRNPLQEDNRQTPSESSSSTSSQQDAFAPKRISKR